MSNSNQEIIEAKLATYIDGELDEADRAELEVHLQQNPQYRRLVEELRKGRDMLRALPRQAAPTELGEAFTSQLERSVLLAGQTDEEAPRMRIGAVPRILAKAAIVFLTFGLAAIVYFVLPGRGGHLVALAPPATQPIATPRDSESDAPSSVPVNNTHEEPNPDPKAVAAAAPPANPIPGNAIKERDEIPAPLDKAAKGGVAAAGPSQDVIALKKTIDNRGELALQSGSRDTELERLARDVSADPQVKELLSIPATDKLGAGKAGESASHAVVMVVRASDPEQVKKELYTYFGDHNIDWQPAPANIEMALNSSLSQQSDRLKSDSDSVREGGARAPGLARPLEETQKNEKLVNAAPSSPGAPASNVPTAGAALLLRAPASPPMAAKAAAPAPFVSKPAAAPVVITPSPAPVAPPQSAALADSETSDAKRQATDKQAVAPSQNKAVAIETLYVARRLSRQQAQELTECLARNGEVRKAGISRPLAESEAIAKVQSPAAPGAPAKVDLASAVPAAPEAAKNGANVVPQIPAEAPAPQLAQSQAVEQARKDAAGYRGSGQLGGGSPRRAADSPVQKGDKLRLSYSGEDGAAEQSETVSVKEDGTIEPEGLASAKGKPVQAAGKTVSEIEAELRASAADTPARTPVQPTKVSRLDSDLDAGLGRPVGNATFGASKGASAPTEVQHRRAVNAPIAEGVDAAAPATGPALAGGVENVVDVVIVVQREVPPAPTTQPATREIRNPKPE